MPSFWRLLGTRPLPRIHLLSDIHLETGEYVIPPGLDYDVLVAAGDIGPVERAIEWLKSLNRPVVYVLGNHEYWGREYSDAVPLARAAAKGTQIRVLEKSATVIHGVRFLGATLWTDFGAWHRDLVDEAKRRMRDYTEIAAHRWFSVKANQTWFWRYCLRAGISPDAVHEAVEEASFHPAIAYQRHQRTLAWLGRALKSQFAGPTVVVTHHSPTFDSLRPFGVPEEMLEPKNWRRREDSLVRVAAYASSLNTFLSRHRDGIDLWAHGHLHHGLDVLSEGVRVVCNPRGYAEAPLDEQRARLLELFGYPVTPADIERSQAMHRERPYLGDAPDFDDALVIDLETEFERPLARAIKETLDTLREIERDTSELAGRLRRTRGPNRAYLVRCLDHDLNTFNATLDALLARIRPSLLRYSWEYLGEPGRPVVFLPHEAGDVPGAYSRAIELMHRWEGWLQALPDLAQSRSVDWARVSRAILSRLREGGQEAWVVRRSTASMRRLGAMRHQIVARHLSEEARMQWEVRLDQEFDGGIPRNHIVSLQNFADRAEQKRSDLLSIQQLDKFLESC